MPNNVGITLSVDFEKYGSVNGKLQELIRQLQNNKISLQVDNNAVIALQKQLDVLKKQMSQTPVFNFDTSHIKSDIEDIDNTLGKLTKKQIKFINGEQVQIIEQMEKSLTESEKIITNIKSQTISNTKMFDYTQLEKFNNELYKQMDTIEALKVKLNSGVSDLFKGDLVPKDKLLELEKSINNLNVGSSKTDIQNIKVQYQEIVNLQKQLNKEKQEHNRIIKSSIVESDKENQRIERLKKEITLTKELMSIKMQNLKTKYGTLVDDNVASDFSNKLNGLNINNFDKEKLANDFKQIEANIKSSSNALKLAQKDATSFGDALIHSTQKFALWMVSATLTMQALKFFREGTQYVLDLNKALTQISIVTGQNQQQVSKLGEEYQKTAYNMSVLTKNIADASVEFYRQGLSQQEVMERTAAATQYAKISNLEFSTSAQILTATVNSMNVDIERASDVFAYLGDATATGADEIGKAYQKVGGVASTLNLSFEKVASWIAVVSAKTREGSESIGNGLKSIMARYTQLRENGFAEEDGTKVNQVAKALASVGIKMIDANGQFENFGTVLDKLGAKWDYLDSRTKAYISTNLGGTFQMSRLQNLLNGYSESVGLYSEALNASGTTTEKYGLYLDSLGAKLDKLKSVWEGIFMNTFQGDDIKDVISMLTTISLGVDAVVGSVGSLNLIIFGLTTLLLATSKGFKAWMMAMDVGKVKSFTTTFSLLPQVMRITSAETGATATKILFLGRVFDVAKIKAIAFQTALTVGIGIAITAAISGITYLLAQSEKAKQSLQDMVRSIPQQAKEFVGQEALLNEMEELSKKENQSIEDKEKLLQIQRTLADSFPNLVSGFDDEGNAIVTNTDAVRELIEEKRELLKLENETMANKANDEIPKLEKQKADLETQIKQLQSNLANGDYRASGVSVKDDSRLTKSAMEDQIVKLTTKYKEVNQELGEYESALNIVQAVEKKEIEGIIKKNVVLAESEAQRDSAIKKLKEEGYSEEIIAKVIEEQTKKIQANTQAKEENNVPPTVDYAKQYEETADSIEKMTSNLDFYNKTLKELDDGGLSSDSFNQILSDYPQLLGYLDDETALRNEITRLISEEETAQQNAYTNMLALSEDYYNAKIKGDVDLQTELNKMYSGYFTGLGEGYKIDMNNYKNLEQAKADMTTKLLQELAGSWSKYWLESGDFSDEMWYGLRYDTEETKKLEGVRDKILAMQDKFKNITIDPISIDVGTVGSSKSGSGGSSSKEISDLEDKTDRYYNLNNAIKEVENSIDLLKTKEDRDTNTKIMEQEISLLEKKKNIYGELYKEQVKEQQELKTKLTNTGFKFNGDDISNYNERIKALTTAANNSTGDMKENAQNVVKDLEETVKRYTTLTKNELAESNKAWYETINVIKEVNKEMFNLNLESISGTYDSGITQLEEKLADLDLLSLTDKYSDDNGEVEILKKKYKIIQDEINKTQAYMQQLQNTPVQNEEQRKELDEAFRVAQNQLRDYQIELLQTTKSTQDKMTEIIKKQVDERKKAIESEYNKQVEMLNKAKELYNRQNNDADNKKELTTERQKLTELRNEYNKASRDMSDSGKARLAAIRKEIEGQEEKITDLILNTEREKQNQQLEDRINQLEEQKKKEIETLEKGWSDERVAQIIANAMSEDFFTQIGNQITNVNSTYTEWLNNLNGGINTTGNNLQSNFINKLEKVKSLLDDINLSNLPSFSDIGGFSVMSSLQNIKVPSVKYPQVSTNSNKNISVDKLVDIHIDNISDLSDATFINKINQFKDVVGDVVESVFMDKVYR